MLADMTNAHTNTSVQSTEYKSEIIPNTFLKTCAISSKCLLYWPHIEQTTFARSCHRCLPWGPQAWTEDLAWSSSFELFLWSQVRSGLGWVRNEYYIMIISYGKQQSHIRILPTIHDVAFHCDMYMHMSHVSFIWFPFNMLCLMSHSFDFHLIC